MFFNRQRFSSAKVAPFLCLVAVFLAFHASAQDVFTDITCTNECGNSEPIVSNGRALGNKVSDSFQGYADVGANSEASTFETNMQVAAGQCWPRMTEGVVRPDLNTPGYPVDVDTYLAGPDRYITYTGAWSARTRGAAVRPAPTGPRYNGAYIWLNNKTNVWDNGNQRWPFRVEINVWNRYDNGVDDVKHICPDYVDGSAGFDVTYSVKGGNVDRGGISKFYAYFLENTSHKDITDMALNTKALLQHLKDCGTGEANLTIGNLNIIEITVAAEGHAGADGKFTANVASMGRP